MITLPIQYVFPLLKFRTSNHKFPVETGRWSNTPYHERFCRFCRNDIGDSFHYLLVCKHFENKRKLLIDKYYYTRPNVLKYKQLLCQENVAVLKKNCLCLTDILQVGISWQIYRLKIAEKSLYWPDIACRITCYLVWQIVSKKCIKSVSCFRRCLWKSIPYVRCCSRQILIHSTRVQIFYQAYSLYSIIFVIRLPQYLISMFHMCIHE